MATAVIMPKFGFTQEDSQLVAWLVDEGAAVEEGDPLAEVTTDKVNMEVEAPESGILGGLRIQPGDTVPVTEVIAYIIQPGEALPEEKPEPVRREAAASTAAPAAPQRPGPAVTPVAARLAQEQAIDLGQVRGSGSGGKITRTDVEMYLAQGGGKVRAAPAARRLGREHGVALESVAGSGPRGRVQAADVLAVVERMTRQAPPSVASAGMRRVPLDKMRRAIAANLQASWQQAPHITFTADIDAGAMLALVNSANERDGGDNGKASLTGAISHAVAWTLQRHPRLNCHLVDDDLLYFDAVHLGVAVALDEGLMVPVIRDAHRKGTRQLSAEIRAVAARARAGTLRPTDLGGATFTISNLGMYGVDQFAAVINPPEVGILAVGSTRRAFVPDVDDRPVLQSRFTITLSADHRAVDGAVAALFMAELRTALEQPGVMTL